jgi:hypothetical protein
VESRNTTPGLRRKCKKPLRKKRNGGRKIGRMPFDLQRHDMAEDKVWRHINLLLLSSTVGGYNDFLLIKGKLMQVWSPILKASIRFLGHTA